MPPRSVQKAKSFLSKIRSQAFQKTRTSTIWNETLAFLDSPDLKIICKDEVPVMTHQIILAGVSPFVKELLDGVNFKTCDGSIKSLECATLLLPDLKSESLKRCLSVLYDGFAEVNQSALESSIFKEMKFIWNNILKIEVVKLKDRDKIMFDTIPKVKNKRTFEMKKEAKISEDLENRFKEVMSVTMDEATSTDYALKTESVTETDLENVLDSALKTPVRTPSSRDSSDNFRTPISTVSSRKRKHLSANKQDNPNDSENVVQEIKDILENSAKKVKKDVIYSVERVHVCLICDGMKNGKRDREGSNLSFSQPRKLKEHYSKHFYDEGKIFEFFPPENGNRNEDGSVKDHFGSKFKYQCEKKSRENPQDPCWKSKKQKCGYKELALHNCTDHELFEEIISHDERPEIQGLIDDLKEHSSGSK